MPPVFKFPLWLSFRSMKKMLDSVEVVPHIHICAFAHKDMRSPEAIVPDFFSALAHPNRIRIMELLRDGELCQCELPDRLGLEQSNLSRHIKILSTSGALRTRRDGTRMMLSVADPRILDILDTVKEMLYSRLNKQLPVPDQTH
jgi:DNA-binding transcriptional ArsR family regulator